MIAKSLSYLVFMLFLSACVTINIYFPAAQAQEAAEQIVEDILQSAPVQIKQTPPAGRDEGAAVEDPQASTPGLALLDFLFPAAHAAQPNFSVNTPEIRKLQASLKQRHGRLVAHFRSGAVGFTRDGMVQIRDNKAIALRELPTVKRLVADENRERAALYQAIAKANAHPEWEKDVRAVFARTWIDKAEKGWWYMNNEGGWSKK